MSILPLTFHESQQLPGGQSADLTNAVEQEIVEQIASKDDFARIGFREIRLDDTVFGLQCDLASGPVYRRTRKNSSFWS